MTSCTADLTQLAGRLLIQTGRLCQIITNDVVSNKRTAISFKLSF